MGRLSKTRKEGVEMIYTTEELDNLERLHREHRAAMRVFEARLPKDGEERMKVFDDIVRLNGGNHTNTDYEFAAILSVRQEVRNRRVRALSKRKSDNPDEYIG